MASLSGSKGQHLAIVTFDVLLVLAICILGTVGLSRASSRSNGEAPFHDMSASDVDSLAARAAAVGRSNASLRAQLDAMSREWAGLADQLQGTQEVTTVEREGAPGDSSGGTDTSRVAALREEIRLLERKIQSLRGEANDLGGAIADLEALESQCIAESTKLGDLNARNSALAQAVSAQRDTLCASRKEALEVERTPLMRSTDRSAIYVALVNGKVALVRDPYYSRDTEVVELGEGCYEGRLKATPSHRPRPEGVA